MIDKIEEDRVLKFKKVYKLIKEYPRFNLYEVSVIDLKTNQEKFVYRETKERKDFGKKLLTKKEILDTVNEKIKLVGNLNELSK